MLDNWKYCKSMAAEEKWSIDKLDGSNWMTWKFQVRHLLLAKGLWGVVDGSETLPEDSSAQVRAEFEKKEQKALSTMALAVSTPQLYFITSLVPRPLFSVFICGGGKRVWWISVRRFVLQTPRFWESLIGVDNYKGLLNKVSITIVVCSYVIK